MEEGLKQRQFGRQAFGLDPAGYDTARPAYPAWVFDFLCEHCGLAPQTATFEIGAGTGTATRQLLKLGASPLIAIEPDIRLATFLRRTNPDAGLSIVNMPFEDAPLPECSFDLGLSATAFHWLDEDLSLAKVARLLRPTAWWAMLWNVFGDHDYPDPFHEATKSLLGPPLGPSGGTNGMPFALDVEARLTAMKRIDAFDSIEHRTSKWTLDLDTEQTLELYATYSNINIRPDRNEVLDHLRRIVVDEFQGRVTRHMITSLYVARRSR
ncbi:class I SAM-dependent methyltransferase [Occallatibacter riparius]|uniref:Class I SAM-dependent methyltransferase n=1 Tax=Occallatibacter riparius TaxID=1002689 RepID=A0A9J7BRM5_9BACT|nr:class I SAM-dependent methyltransferase [Occallatibacter riparius]UWZ85540.1 class I SAM-dependent methyltransferase [Occallatibacter riparius]